MFQFLLFLICLLALLKLSGPTRGRREGYYSILFESTALDLILEICHGIERNNIFLAFDGKRNQTLRSKTFKIPDFLYSSLNFDYFNGDNSRGRRNLAFNFSPNPFQIPASEDYLDWDNPWWWRNFVLRNGILELRLRNYVRD